MKQDKKQLANAKKDQRDLIASLYAVMPIKKKTTQRMLFSQQSTALASQITQQLIQEKTVATSQSKRSNNYRLSLLEKVIQNENFRCSTAIGHEGDQQCEPVLAEQRSRAVNIMSRTYQKSPTPQLDRRSSIGNNNAIIVMGGDEQSSVCSSIPSNKISKAKAGTLVRQNRLTEGLNQTTNCGLKVEQFTDLTSGLKESINITKPKTSNSQPRGFAKKDHLQLPLLPIQQKQEIPTNFTMPAVFNQSASKLTVIHSQEQLNVEPANLRASIRKSRNTLLDPILNRPTVLDHRSPTNVILKVEPISPTQVILAPISLDTRSLSPTAHNSLEKDLDTKSPKQVQVKPSRLHSQAVSRRDQSVPQKSQVTIEDEKSPLRLMTRGTNAAVEQVGISQIYCQSFSSETFIRRAVKRMGWAEVPQNKECSSMFHIRFNISDLEGALNDLKANQFYNHHPSNRELTTKAGLCKNLWQGCFSEHEHRISQMFPRCYDLSDLKQASDFVHEFKQTSVLSIIKIFANHYLDTNPILSSLVAQYEQHTVYQNPRVFKAKFKLKCDTIDVAARADGLLGSEKLRYAYLYAKSYLVSHQFQDGLKPKRTKKKKDIKLTDEYLPQMIEYHRTLVDKGVPKFGISTYEQFKIVKIYQQLNQILPQFRTIDGSHNIWIVKPSYTSCGWGIYCSRTLNQIMPDKQKTQQKIVQKYIETPLLINSAALPKRKFDFRQWVLVLSWEPLDICVFESCYLKICGQDFDLNLYEDTLRHLSNYSLNKGNEKSKDLVMSSGEFEEYMAGFLKQDFSWRSDMLPKINDVVWRSLKSLQETQDQRQNSFEIYGFDIVLNQNLDPWVIEINLSPACAERAEFLTKMLDDSAIDLLGHLQNKILVQMGNDHWSPEMRDKCKVARQNILAHQSSQFLNPDTFYSEFQVKNKWLRLPQSIEEIKIFNNTNYLMMQSTKVDLLPQVSKMDQKTEKRIDRAHGLQSSALLIWRVWLGFKARQVAKGIRQNRASIVVQKYLRSYKAKQLAAQIRQMNASIVIQAQLRGFLAKQVLKELRLKQIRDKKQRLTLSLQCLYRCKVSRLKTQQLRLSRAAVLVQKAIRGFRDRKNVQKMRKQFMAVILIQRAYVRRFRIRHRCATLLQSLMRKYKQKKRILKLLPINRAQFRCEAYLRKLKLKQGFQKMIFQVACVKIQCCLRRYLAALHLNNLRKLQAQRKLKQFFRLMTLGLLKKVATLFKTQLLIKVVLLQKMLRGRKAKIVIRRMRIKASQLELQRQRQAELLAENQRRNDAAAKIQKLIRLYMTKKQAFNQMIKQGAAVMIQSCWRGFIARRNEKRDKDKIIEANTQQTKNNKKFLSQDQYKQYVKSIKQAAAQDSTYISEYHKKQREMSKKAKNGNWEHFSRAKKEVKQSHGKGRPSNTNNDSSFTARALSRTFVETSVIGNDEIHQRLRPSTFANRSVEDTKSVTNRESSSPGSPEEVKRKTFAQNLIERLEDQKKVTLDRVTRIVDSVEKTSAMPGFDPRLQGLQTSLPLRQQQFLKLIAPATREIDLPYLNNVKQLKPVKAFKQMAEQHKSDFQLRFEQTQKEMQLQKQVVIENYSKAAKKFRQNTEELVQQMQKTNQRNVEAVVHGSKQSRDSKKILTSVGGSIIIF